MWTFDQYIACSFAFMKGNNTPRNVSSLFAASLRNHTAPSNNMDIDYNLVNPVSPNERTSMLPCSTSAKAVNKSCGRQTCELNMLG